MEPYRPTPSEHHGRPAAAASRVTPTGCCPIFDPDLYFGYTTCPRCAKAYGKNYVVLFAQVA